jgi:hypothetical protein
MELLEMYLLQNLYLDTYPIWQNELVISITLSEMYLLRVYLNC